MIRPKVCRVTVFVLVCVSTLSAQQQSGPQAERNTKLLLERVASGPLLQLERQVLALQPPHKDWRIERPSSVAVGPDGVFYVLQRGSDAVWRFFSFQHHAVDAVLAMLFRAFRSGRAAETHP